MSEEKDHQSIELGRTNGASSPPLLPQPVSASTPTPRSTIHPSVYIATWIGVSSTVIIFNKWLLDKKGFAFPISLTTWHLVCSTIITQLMARFTTLLDSRKKVPMTGRVYLRAIVPIGVSFSLSLMFNNMAYIYLSVSFIQMLKATTPVATLLASWTLGTKKQNLKTLGNVSAIVVGVIIASFGEIKFVLAGFLLQMAGITFEATRLAMIEQLLSSDEFKMDPLVSLYYFAPVCALMNFIAALLIEASSLTMERIMSVGIFTFAANAGVAFCLNVTVVLLIGKTSALALTLSGVLKDILLVVASMVLFGDPVSGLQAFGYSIALCGLVYYKLGSEAIKQHVAEAQRSWAEYGTRAPIMRKIIIAGLALLLLFVLLGGFAPNQSISVLQSAVGRPQPAF